MPDDRSKHRVLCVDDHADFAQLWTHIVDCEPDLTSVGALTNVEHLEREVCDRRAAIVLLDMTMPGRDPLEAMAALAATAPSVLIVALSGFDDDVARGRAMAAGAAAFLSKSLEPIQVLATIRTLLARRADGDARAKR
jgi:DNA-binding NarL/FixJ family response regulator